MTGGERNDMIANRIQTLELRSKVYRTRSLFRPSLVEARNTYWISCSNCPIFTLIVQHPRKHSIEHFRGIKPMFKILNPINKITCDDLILFTRGIMTSQSECVLNL